MTHVQYRHLIPAPVDPTTASTWLYTYAWIACKNNNLMTHVACKSKLRSVGRSSLYPCPRNWVALGRAVVYYDRAALEFSARIKCRHCSLRIKATFSCNVGDLGSHPCPENWVAIRPAVVYFARAASATSAGIKCWHCTNDFESTLSITITQLCSKWSIAD